jgi:PAS domain S-box-containing protein
MTKRLNEELKKELIELKNNGLTSSKDEPYKNFFDKMSEMVEIIELIYDKNNQPIDFYIRTINISFAKFLGKTQGQLVNKKVSFINDTIEENWFTSFAKVDKTGKPISFKNYGAAFDKYYFVSAWKISKKKIGVSFIDITKTEKNKIKLKEKLKNESKRRTKVEFLLEDGKLELYQTIKNLDALDKKSTYQNSRKGENSRELRRVKGELKQKSFYLNKVAIVSETDADFNILFVNDNFCEIYGYQREELIGQNHRILKSGKQPEAFFVDMISTIISGGVFKGEVLNKKNGVEEYYWMDLTIMPFKDLNGKIIRFVSIMFDITTQIKQKEIHLNQSKELVLANKELAFQNKEKEKRANELVLANTELAFQNKEKEKRANELNIANTELAFQNEEKEKRAEELVLANTELAFQNKEKEKRANELVLANTELAFQNKEKEKRANELILANTELAFQNKEKEKRANELAIAKKELAFQKELDGYRSKMEHIARDLTLLIDTANAPIFGIDSKGLVNEWNQTSEKITGFKKEDVFSKNLVQTYITEDYRESVKKVLDDALIGKETANFEFPLFTKNGQRVMVLLNSSTRRDANGKITGVIGVGQDITELVGYRNELEKKVNERTIKLNKALHQEKELNELKSKFVSTASHEFRTPLSAINFAAGSIKKYWAKMEPIMIEKKLDKIEDQVVHMTQLLDDILIVGQADAGKFKNNPIPINFGNFIDEIIEEVYNSQENSHEILLIDAERLKKSDIFIDEKLGRNIFINLISNAIKFSPNAKKVYIELASKKNHIIISIIDYGIGIHKSELKNIFHPFARGHNVDLIQGTGLGLSIAKEAIEVMGGEIIVNSTIGSGTSFIVKIPKKTK